MPGVMRHTEDRAGGLAIYTSNSSVYANGRLIMRVGDVVSPHDCCTTYGGGGECLIHCRLVPMVQGSPNVFAVGIPVCRAGDLAECGHAATGSHNVFANS